MTTLGKVDKFDANKEEWSQYEERLIGVDRLQRCEDDA